MAGPELLLPLTLFAGTIFAGVLAHRAFQSSGVPDVLVLMGLGLLLGPLLGLLDPGALRAYGPLMGAFALLVILLEGGLHLKFKAVRTQARAAFSLALASGVLTALGVAAVAAVGGLGFWPLGLLLGVAVAPIGPAVVIPLLASMRTAPATRAIVTVECTVDEGFAVVGVFALAEMAALGAFDLPMVAEKLAATFGLGVLAALLGAMAWLRVLRLLGHDAPYSYMVTLAAAVALFAGIQALGGNGFVGVLVFGLALGNANALQHRLPRLLRGEAPVNGNLRGMNTEVSFLVRTLYFVYLGLTLSLAAFTPPSLLLASLLLGAIVGARALAVRLVAHLHPREGLDVQLLSVMVPRGLAAAVLATVPLSFGVPGSERLVQVVSILIVLTNLAMTVGLVALRRREAPLTLLAREARPVRIAKH